MSEHRLTAGTPLALQAPHSRWNGVPEDNLTDCGYRVLTRAADAGIDTFIKQQKALFVFFQGHPEYESDTCCANIAATLGATSKGNRQVPFDPAELF